MALGADGESWASQLQADEGASYVFTNWLGPLADTAERSRASLIPANLDDRDHRVGQAIGAI